MDVGDSLNPAIDIGQIEGAFVQVVSANKIDTDWFFYNLGLWYVYNGTTKSVTERCMADTWPGYV